jgi:aryl-alcohol dehydrogenase-like predicted oxidoreductase
MMSFGVHERRPWALDEAAAEPIVRRAVQGGITFFDTADSYAAGASEVITGRLVGKLLTREEAVVATKVNGPTMPGENGRGLSRKHILASIDASLTRLGMDYVDLYQIHRWDYATPIEETMAALHDVVRSGKARYIGASSMFAWQFAKAQTAAALHRWTRFDSMQNHYNLVYREEEREMIPMCVDQGVGVIPWSPLARVARTRSVSSAQVALAWLLHKPGVTAPIVGATKVAHVEDALAAVELGLDESEIASLEEPYVPHRAHVPRRSVART